MSEHSSLPRLSIATLGGTVSMRAGAVGGGVTPSLDCERQLLQVPQLREMAQLNVASLCLLPSASLDFATLLEVLAWARGEVERGAQALVLSQGTDSLEETAYFLDLLWPFEVPLVMTGAMRSASQPGNDGPANVLAAAQVALAKDSHGRGVLVVMNDQVHCAARVRKTASLAMAAFESPGCGPLGDVVEGSVLYRHPPGGGKCCRYRIASTSALPCWKPAWTQTRRCCRLWPHWVTKGWSSPVSVLVMFLPVGPKCWNTWRPPCRYWLLHAQGEGLQPGQPTGLLVQKSTCRKEASTWLGHSARASAASCSGC